MELKCWGRKSLDFFGAYHAYSRYRDGKLLRVESSGTYTDSGIWESIALDTP
jgi:hypothetical protein